MSPEPARATWTDERLDDLARGMDAGFSRLDGEIDALRIDLGGRIDRQAERIDALQKTLLQIGGGMIASILVGAAGIAATQV